MYMYIYIYIYMANYINEEIIKMKVDPIPRFLHVSYSDYHSKHYFIL